MKNILSAFQWLRKYGLALKNDTKEKAWQPSAGESEKAFMDRCMHYMMKEAGKGQAQATAICMSSWRDGHKK